MAVQAAIKALARAAIEHVEAPLGAVVLLKRKEHLPTVPRARALRTGPATRANPAAAVGLAPRRGLARVVQRHPDAEIARLVSREAPVVEVRTRSAAKRPA